MKMSQLMTLNASRMATKFYMSILVFDVETTGFPSLNHPHDHPTQGRIIQLAAGLYDMEFNEIAFYHTLIAIPQDIQMHPEALKTHGITLEYARRYGIEILPALINLQLFAASSAVQVGHNIAFDIRAIGVEEKFFDGCTPLNLTNRICTMAGMTNICKLSKSNGQKKAPNLDEAYEHAGGTIFNTMPFHSAVHDVKKVHHIYRWLVQNGEAVLPNVIIEPELTSQ